MSAPRRRGGRPDSGKRSDSATGKPFRPAAKGTNPRRRGNADSGNRGAVGESRRAGDRQPGRRQDPQPGGASARGGAGNRYRNSASERTDRSGARRGAPSGSGSRASVGRGAGRPARDASRAGSPHDRAAKPTADVVAVPEDADVRLLDRSVRAELRSLSKVNADAVAKYLVAAGQVIDTDPTRALAYAHAARSRAARVAAVREAVGIAAYHAGEWSEALTELRTARRISGDPRNLPVIADCERALGRPEQAARVLGDPEVRRLDAETRAELLIVVAGARRDLGQLEAALAVLARGGLDRDRPRPGAARLWYAYADTLLAAGRPEEAAGWFAASAAVDPEGELDAADRAASLL